MRSPERYRYLIHDRDRISSPELESALKAMGLRILKTPFRAPRANAYCERLVGSIRREALDFLIPLNGKPCLPKTPSGLKSLMLVRSRC